MEVIAAALQAWENHPAKIGIQQIEGFIRQILGWREYMRGIYWTLMPDLEAMNFFDQKAALPKFYWTYRSLCSERMAFRSARHTIWSSILETGTWSSARMVGVSM